MVLTTCSYNPKYVVTLQDKEFLSINVSKLAKIVSKDLHVFVKIILSWLQSKTIFNQFF